MADPKSMSNEELLNLIKKTTSPSSKTASHSKSLSHTLGNDDLDKTDVSSDINPKEDGNILKEDSPVGELSEDVGRFTPDIESLTTVNSDLQPSDQHSAKLQGENMEFENCDKCKGEGVVKKTMNAVVKSSDSVEIDEELVTLLSKEEITNLLHEYRTELETNKQKLVQCERQLNKANDYNDVLRNMVEKLSGEIHRYRHMKTCDKDVQVDNDDFNNYINGVVTMPTWQDDTPYIQIDTTQIIENNALDEIPTGSLSIADSIKQTAECVVQQQQYNQLTDLGYMYDEQSGLYYHSASGYYYDQTKSLFYDPNTGIYYYYDYDSGQYVFHSQIELQHSNNEVKLNTQDENTGRKTPAGKNTPRKKEISKSSRKRSGRDKNVVRKDEMMNEVMTGLEDLMISPISRNHRQHALEVANSWAPCIRVIVTDSDCIDIGTFYMITCTGGKIGRENCDINIPDINISKSHAVISYKTETRHYEIIDLASQNGTFINQHRLSPSKIASEPYKINHGDTIQIGSTILLCHIHHGTDTCDQCEPGVVQASLKSQQSQQEYKVLSKEERLRLKKQELYQIKKKYGLKNSSYEDNKEIFKNPNYVDKAEERRKAVGSEHPSIKKHETPASVHRPISSGNIGHKLLQKMGWKEGESLGKNNSGLQEPISVTLRANQTAGLGSSDAGNFSQDHVNTSDMKKASRRIQAQQRYQQIDTGKLSTSDKASNKQWKQGGTEYT
ncbi:Angiogenic factor with G patch and FHA domains 1 [Mactra antiquata]